MSGLLGSILGQLLPTQTQSQTQSQAQSQAQKTQAQTPAQASSTVAVSSPSPLPSPNGSSSLVVAQTSAPAEGNAPATTNNSNSNGNDSPSSSDASSQGAQTKTTASALATSIAGERTSVPASTSAQSTTGNPLASSAVSDVHQLIPTTLATSVSSSNVVSASSTSNIAAIETAAGTGDGYSPITNNNSGNSSKAPVAGVIVASVVGLMLGAGIIFLIFRYCKPVRRRHEAWQERKLLEKKYRGGMGRFPDPIESKMMEKSAQFRIDPYAAYKTDASSMGTLSRQQTPSSESTRTEDLRDTALGSGNRHSPSPTPKRAPSRGAVYTVFPPAWHYNRDLPLPPLPH